MAKIFISYRREDSQYQTDKLYELLAKHVAKPREDIFLDVDNIPFGIDFVEYLDGKVAACKVLLAVIGAGWLEARDPTTGERRLDDPKDFVRIEISSALERGIPVVPILLDGVSVPVADALPDVLKPLARRHGISVSRRSFEMDVAALVSGLPVDLKIERPLPELDVSKTVASGTSKAPGGKVWIVGLIAVFILAGLGGVFAAGVFSPSEKTAVSHRVGEVFQDTLANGRQGPEMVVLEAGSFMMGPSSIEVDQDQRDLPRRDLPRHKVLIADDFAVSKYEITWTEWSECVEAGVCEDNSHKSSEMLAYDPKFSGDSGFGRGSRPVINVAWEDAKAYVAWLNTQVPGRPYRLLSEAEWEYAVRGGSISIYPWGRAIGVGMANCITDTCGESYEGTAPVGSFPPNGYGLHDMNGNVREWVEDCYVSNYEDAPTDGSPHILDDCRFRVLRGGSWLSVPVQLRSSTRDYTDPTNRDTTTGFRIARTL